MYCYTITYKKNNNCVILYYQVFLKAFKHLHLHTASLPICHGATKAVKAAKEPPAEKPTKINREGLNSNKLISSCDKADWAATIWIINHLKWKKKWKIFTWILKFESIPRNWEPNFPKETLPLEHTSGFPPNPPNKKNNNSKKLLVGSLGGCSRGMLEPSQFLPPPFLHFSQSPTQWDRGVQFWRPPERRKKTGHLMGFAWQIQVVLAWKKESTYQYYIEVHIYNIFTLSLSLYIYIYLPYIDIYIYILPTASVFLSSKHHFAWFSMILST